MIPNPKLFSVNFRFLKNIGSSYTTALKPIREGKEKMEKNLEHKKQVLYLVVKKLQKGFNLKKRSI